MTQRTSLKKTSNGLVGALAIAAGTQAYGQVTIVNTPADLTNTPGGANTTVNWDVNSDGVTDFTFLNRYPNTAAGDYGVIWQLSMNPFSGTSATNGVVSYQALVRYAFALRPGTPMAFSTGTQVVLGSRYSYGDYGSYFYGGFAADGRTAGTTANGAVAPGTPAYAGFRFTAADGTHYGYIHLSVNAGLIDFVDAAYNATPNAAITTPNGATVVPEPSTLALLALGAVGIVGAVAKRRRG